MAGSVKHKQRSRYSYHNGNQPFNGFIRRAYYKAEHKQRRSFAESFKDMINKAKNSVHRTTQKGEA